MKKIYRNLRWFVVAGMFLTTTSCLRDLDVQNKDDDAYTVDKFYANPDSYKSYLAKIYGGLALTGQASPSGDSDLNGLVDEGFSQYLRGYWQLQELTTDEAIIAWKESDNPTIKDLNFNTWDSNNKFSEALFERLFFQIGLVNEFLRETTDAKLNSRDVTAALKTDIKTFRAEARFLRALSYYHAIDLFGKAPFATEENALGTTPIMKNRTELFDYVISELNAIEPDILASNEYGRADKTALSMLKAKLYMNSKVYTGVDRSTEALAAVEAVLNSKYRLASKRENLFLADNDVNGAQNEIIFPIRFDGVHTKTWGGMTFLIHSSCDSEIGKTLGIDFGWQGHRARKEFVDAVGGDARVNVVQNADPASIDNYLEFKEGKKLIKFSNKSSAGVAGTDLTFPDTDFPMFRLGDAYLMYAELAVVNGKGDKGRALTYINELRRRSGVGEAALSDLTPDFILKERAKELFWEGHRRQDLIRFGKYLSGYNWEWKGGVKSGTALDAKRLLFALPYNAIKTNPNLSQNEGY